MRACACGEFANSNKNVPLAIDSPSTICMMLAPARKNIIPATMTISAAVPKSGCSKINPAIVPINIANGIKP